MLYLPFFFSRRYMEITKMKIKYNEIVRKKIPLVHCITNYVTVNDVANALLALGGSPIMADDIDECAEITAISQAMDTVRFYVLAERSIVQPYTVY